MRPRLLSFELAWTDAAFDAIFPAPPAPPAPPALAGSADEPARPLLVHGIAEMHPGAYLDGVLRAIPLEQAIGLRLTLWMIALAPLFTIKKLGTIASLGVADRMRVLELLVASPIYVVRQMTVGLKAVATLLYAQSKAIRSQMAAPVAPGPAAARLVSETRLKRRGPGAEDKASAASAVADGKEVAA